ncbi:MAG: DUF4384 domain-containing protein [Proteobacteria bacterium]|nr:DUF4384 domain-containing protein [Pseudomonadota bacterium]
MSSTKKFYLPLIISLILPAGHAFGRDIGAEATTAAAPKTPAVKTITSFSQALRCMDELFLGFGKQGIVITSAGIPDETGKVKTGTKEMVITAIAKMTVKSNAFEFIDFHSQGDDLGNMFNAMGDRNRKMPDYYVRGSITQMDDNAVRKNKGAGISLPFLDFGYSKDESFDLISMDMSVGEAATRKILAATSTSNTMVITKGGKSGEGGGKLGKLGLSFNVDLSRSEGLGASTRTLLELGLIETLGKFTQVPYWRCLDTDLTNPLIRDQARENYETLKDKELVTFIQRKLGGSMNRYKGPIDGVMNDQLKTAIAEYQSQTGLIANSKIDFDLYASLLDDTQNMLAAMPTTPPVSAYVPGASAAVSSPPPVAAVAPAPAPAASTAQFRVNLESDRGAKPSYKIGELLNLNLSLNGHGTAYCYYEDATKNTARIFPNQFHADASLKAGGNMQLPSGGFKIKFDQAGRERVACIGADRELIVPGSVKGAQDLRPLGRALDDIVNQFKQANPTAVASFVEITVTR